MHDALWTASKAQSVHRDLDGDSAWAAGVWSPKESGRELGEQLLPFPTGEGRLMNMATSSSPGAIAKLLVNS